MIADGKKIAETLEAKLAETFAGLSPKKVCFVLFADNPASRQFIARKSAVGKRLGVQTDLLEKTDTVTTEDCVRILEDLATKKYDGIVVQLPVPADVDVNTVLNAVPERADIDVLGEKTKQTYLHATAGDVPVPALVSVKTPPVGRAVWEILTHYAIDVANKKILIIGNGRLVGEPVAMKFTHMNLPYEIIDLTTPEADRLARIASADIIISGIGVAHFIKPEMVKQGVVLIDASTSESAGKLVGDIDPACVDRASFLTPVPGGVGPVTVASLFANLV